MKEEGRRPEARRQLMTDPINPQKVTEFLNGTLVYVRHRFHSHGREFALREHFYFYTINSMDSFYRERIK